MMLSYALWVFYHMAVMNWLAVWTLANIGSMLCPAITDPFPPAMYRIHGLWHQLLAVFLMGALGAVLLRLTAGGGRKSAVLAKTSSD